MGVLDNKHLRWAMLIAPVLGIVSYVGVDYVVSEKPTVAIQGKSYPLAAKSNCRYTSGQCTLKNGEVEVKIVPHRIDDTLIELRFTSELPLQSVLLSHTDGDESSEPKPLTRQDDAGREWSGPFALPKPADSQLRVVLVLEGSRYFVETSAVFVDTSSLQVR